MSGAAKVFGRKTRLESRATEHRKRVVDLRTGCQEWPGNEITQGTILGRICEQVEGLIV